MLIPFFSNAQENPLQAEISFDTSIHDFGNWNQFEKCEYKFIYTNTGSAPLIISNVKSGCGCTIPYWTKEPVQPGEKGEITVKYDSKRVGSFNKSVRVYTNSGNEPVILRIKGIIIAKPSPVKKANLPNANN